MSDRTGGTVQFCHSLVLSPWASHRNTGSHTCNLRQLLPHGAVMKTTDTGVGVPAGTVSVSVGARSLSCLYSVLVSRTIHKGASLPSHSRLSLRILLTTWFLHAPESKTGYAFSSEGPM